MEQKIDLKKLPRQYMQLSKIRLTGTLRSDNFPSFCRSVFCNVHLFFFTHTHLVARRRATTRSFYSLLSAISAAISLASNAPVSLYFFWHILIFQFCKSFSCKGLVVLTEMPGYTTRSFHSLLSAISAAISLASNAPVSLYFFWHLAFLFFNFVNLFPVKVLWFLQRWLVMP